MSYFPNLNDEMLGPGSRNLEHIGNSNLYNKKFYSYNINSPLKL